ncbi:MAG: alpha/beta hydrolase [Cyanobacteria bacterium P01_C01_bin.120]
MADNFVNNLSLINQGDGAPALIFLHYFSGAAASWQWVTEKLKQDFQCIALDLPGFGNAPALDKPTLRNYSSFVYDALACLGIERFVLIGHSMGGKIALQVAADNCPGLEQVILVAPSPVTQEPMPQKERERLLQGPESLETAQNTVKGAIQKPLSQIRRAIAVRTHQQAEDKTWRWWLLQGMDHSIAEQMAQVKVPITVLASTDDPVIPLETIQHEVMELLPTGDLVKVTGVGHLMPLEDPDMVTQVIRATVSKEPQGNCKG